MLLLPIRRRPAAWLLLPALLLVLLYDYVYLNSRDYSGYWLAVTAQSAIFLYLSSAPAAASAALEGSRFRRAAAELQATGRPHASIVLQQIWPSLVVGGLIQTFGLLLLSRDSIGAPGGPPMLLLLAFAVIIVFHTLLGYLLGRTLPTVLSVPLAVLISYVWLGFAWATPYFPLRYLAGLALSGCCALDETMPSAAPWAAIAFSAIAAAGFALFVIIRARRTQIATAVAAIAIGTCLATGAAAGVALADDLPGEPHQPRPVAELRCEGESPEICLYPEQESDQTRLVLTGAYDAIESAGLSLAPRIAASNQPSTTDTYNMAINFQPTADELVYSYATSFLQPTVVGDCEDDYEARMEAAAIVVSWLTAQAASGVEGASGLAYGFFGTGESGARRLQTLPLESQAAWITQSIPALYDCDAQLPAVPQA
jgi:hypothetical protein